MAQFNMGWMYENGNGVEVDKAMALEWYLKSARGGHNEAPNFIGVLYDVGDEVPEDDVRAYAWWIIGVERGDNAPLNNMEFLGQKLTPEEKHKARKLAEALEAEMVDAQKKP
jgi:hypothetical protein